MKPIMMFLVLCVALLAFSGAMTACKEECPPCPECEVCEDPVVEPTPTPDIVVSDDFPCPPDQANVHYCSGSNDVNCFRETFVDRGGNQMCVYVALAQ